MKLYHGSDAGGLQTLTPRLADHGKPYVYLTDNRVAAALYAARAVEPPHYWVPYGFDSDGTPVYHELYSNALYDVYGRKCGYLYQVEAWETQVNPLEGIPGAFTGLSPFSVTDCEALPDVYEWLLREEADGRLRVCRFQEKTPEELDGWYTMIRKEIEKRGLREKPNCSYAQFLLKKTPKVWGQ